MKSKLIQSIFFSSVITILIVVGSVYLAGKKGPILQSGSLTPEGKLGAGFFSISILIYFWSFANLYNLIFKTKNKSLILNIILGSNFILMPLSIFMTITYLALNKDKEENIEVIKKNEEVNKNAKTVKK